jgi:restriction system protein
VGGASVSDIYEALANEVKLTADDRAELLPSGTQAVYKNRIGWAHDRLKRSALSGSPKRGFWKLTPEGITYAAQHPTISDPDLEQLASAYRIARLRVRRDEAIDETAQPVVDEPAATKESPEDRIGTAVAELRSSVARDLLENIGRSPPEFFEQLVLDLLHSMGYGTNRTDLQRVGGSGDGGIDGIISLDKLGLEKVYVQAKRWKNTVGSPDIQGFMGALQLQGAAKGVFITTSAFTRDAKESATRARGSIVLVDGALLTNLMIDHGVGVSHVPLRIPKVDNDYFEDL